MYRYLLFPFLLLFLLVGCSSKKVETDYDPSFATDNLKTFAVVHTRKPGLETLDDERIREAIIREMKQKGYLPMAEEKADFHITFQTSVEENVPSNVSFGFGVGRYSGRSGASVSTARNVTHDKEHIGINMVDPATNKTFWRAAVSNNRRDFTSPQDRTDYIHKTVSSMLKEFLERSHGK